MANRAKSSVETAAVSAEALLPPRRAAFPSQAPAPASAASMRWLVDLADVAAGLVDAPLGRGTARRRWVVRESGPSLEILRVTRGAPETLARVSEGDEPGAPTWRRDLAAAEIVELRLDPATIVRQRFSLPAESRDFAAAIIEHRLDRLTPWNAADVVYGYNVRPGAGRADPVEIDFVATSRDIATAAITKLLRIGRAPTAIGSADDPVGEPVTVDLLGNAVGRRGARRRILRRLCLAALPLSLAAFLGTLVWQMQAQAGLDSASATLDRQRRMVQALGTNGEQGQSAASLLAAKTLDGATFALINRLARTIPDGTVLTDLEISAASVHLKGWSADAPALVPILESEAGLKDVRFEAPVIREANGGDRFDVVAARKTTASAPTAERP